MKNTTTAMIGTIAAGCMLLGMISGITSGCATTMTTMLETHKEWDSEGNVMVADSLKIKNVNRVTMGSTLEKGAGNTHYDSTEQLIDADGNLVFAANGDPIMTGWLFISGTTGEGFVSDDGSTLMGAVGTAVGQGLAASAGIPTGGLGGGGSQFIPTGNPIADAATAARVSALEVEVVDMRLRLEQLEAFAVAAGQFLGIPLAGEIEDVNGR